MSPPMVPKFIGARVRRKEDPRLISGTATYTDDITLPRMAYAALTRSTEAHARVAAVDTTGAAGLPGVLAVYTGADLKDAIAPLPCVHSIEGLKEPPHPAVAVDEVNYVGDAVAVVIADTPAQAEDAARAVMVEYEPLPVVTDVVAAADAGAALVHVDLETNVAFTSVTDVGDVDAAFDAAAIVLEEHIVNQRQIPIAMEPRAVVADFDPGYDKLTVWTTTQVPHFVRLLVAAVCGHPENKVRVVAPEVGGGFGSKLNFYAEEALVAHTCRRLMGRPVKWTGRRTEDILATTHGRDQVCDLQHRRRRRRQAARHPRHSLPGSGRLSPVAHAGDPRAHGGYAAGLLHAREPACDAARCVHQQDTYRRLSRRRAPRGHIHYRALHRSGRARGIGKRPGGCTACSTFPAADAFPFTTATQGCSTTRGITRQALDTLLDSGRTTRRMRAQQEQRRAGENAEIVGIGLSTYVEVCGIGPSAAMTAGGWEACELEVRRTGKVDRQDRHFTPRPGRRDHLRADRCRWFRLDAGRRRGPARRHRHHRAGHRHLRVARPGGGRRRAVALCVETLQEQGAAYRRAPARGRCRRRHRFRGRQAVSQGGAGHRRWSSSRSSMPPTSPAPCRRRSSPGCRRPTSSTRPTSPSRLAPTWRFVAVDPDTGVCEASSVTSPSTTADASSTP